MISKEEFQSAIFALKENMDFEDELNTLLNATYCNKLSDTVINLLNKSMNLTGEFDTIGWWIYELDFGKYGNNCVEVDGKSISLKSATDLYDYLMEYEVKKDDE